MNVAFTEKSSTNQGRNSNAPRGDVGSINLRNLGSVYSLLLVNGRRTVQHPISSGAVTSYNANTIPTFGLKSIDLLLDGGAAVYGSDAVAGVVNLVTASNLEGGGGVNNYIYVRPDAYWVPETLRQGADAIRLTNYYAADTGLRNVNVNNDQERALAGLRGKTYGVGRFLKTEPVAADGTVVVDFNRAYNPSCAFASYATCPLPPQSNYFAQKDADGKTTRLAVVAGEKKYAGEH